MLTKEQACEYAERLNDMGWKVKDDHGGWMSDLYHCTKNNCQINLSYSGSFAMYKSTIDPGKWVVDKVGGITVYITPSNSTYDGDKIHHSNLEDHFEDFLSPTEGELTLYTLATGLVFDTEFIYREVTACL